MRYLIVAHQTAQSSQLLAATHELIARDPATEFVLLIPKTPTAALLTGEKGSAEEIARRRAQTASAWLRDAGIPVLDARAGNEDPVEAVAQALKDEDFAGVVVSTLPQGISQWLRMDVVSRIRRQHPSLQVEHVICELPAAAAPT